MVQRSTARAVCEIEVNSGRRASGDASIAASTSVAKPSEAQAPSQQSQREPNHPFQHDLSSEYYYLQITL